MNAKTINNDGTVDAKPEASPAHPLISSGLMSPMRNGGETTQVKREPGFVAPDFPEAAPAKVGSTPGPWRVQSAKDRPELAAGVEPNICEMVSSLSHAEVSANARLIAAAPAMLAACHSAANRLECILADYSGTQSDKDTLRTVRAAIALVEGGDK